MIPGVTLLSQGLSPFPFEVDRGGIKENQVQPGKEVAAFQKQSLFHAVFDASGGKGDCSSLVGQLLSQKRHGAIEVVQGEILHPLDGIIPAPLLAGAVRSGEKESVQDGEEDGSFHRKAELPPFQKALEDLVEMELLPEPLEEERRADPLGRSLAIAFARKNQKDSFGESGEGADQVFDLSPFPQVIHATQRAEDALEGPFSLPAILNDLEVLMGPRFLDAGEHGMSPFLTPRL
jgi:hypothetical protein